MSSSGNERALARLAASCGVQPFYRDVLGRRRDPSTEALLAMLRALGEPVETPDDAPAVLAARRAHQARRPVAPVCVAWERQRGSTVRLTVPATGGAVECRLALEGGSTLSWKRDAGRLATVGRCDGGGGTWLDVKRLPLPRDLPRGYHRLQVSVGAAGERRSGDSLLVVAPRRVYAGEEHAGDAEEGRREWGVFLPLYALRREGEDGVADVGVGDLSGLEQLGRWVAGLGGSTVATLPLLAAFLYGDDPFEYSPYGPASRLFWNELYVDPGRLPELARSPQARRLLESAGFRRQAAKLAAEPLVDYRQAAALRRKVLQPLAKAFFAAGAPQARRDALEELRRRRPEVDDYAAFRAACEHHGGPWQTWPDAARGGELTAADQDREAFAFHLYAQLAADEQVAEAAETLSASGGLYLDLPLGVHPSSYDVWRERDLFVSGASAGAPPDALFTGGQDWGFHPVHPERQREQGYRHFIAVLRHHLTRAGMLRIDHAMQLHRLYCIPHGVDKQQGIYLRYPAQELYAILSLESHRSRCRVVGENLGTVPRYVDRNLSAHGILKMFILPFEVDPSQPGDRLHRPVARDEVASLNTHDMPSFRAFWEGAEIDQRRELGLIDDGEAAREKRQREEARDLWRHRLAAGGYLRPGAGDAAAGAGAGDEPQIVSAALATLADSDAPLVLVNLEDLWGEAEPQNVPGTWRELPNWRRRADLSLEQAARDSGIRAVLERVDALRRGETAAPPELPAAVSEPASAEGTALGALRAVGADTLLADDDLYLFNEGRHFHLYGKLGAHRRRLGGEDGYHFAVWAPNAEGVSVVGDFNGWNRDSHPLTARGASGIWEGFLPGARPGQNYKFHVRSRFGGYRVDKADPFAVRSEVPPKTGSVLWHLDYEWGDRRWMEGRAATAALDAPVSIYEMHLGSWRRVPEDGDRSLTYREMAAPLADHLERCGFTHVELLPVMEHPFYGSWGYQTTGYFTPTARYGTPQDLMYLIDYLHQRGLGVILDWVPSHFPSDEHGPGYFDGTHLFEHSDPRLGYHPDWNSFIFNYGRHEVRSFLISSALFWLDHYHADGLRVDAVASMLYRDYSRKEGEWIPNVHGGRENLEAISFLRQLNEAVYEHFPGVQTFAEESTAWPQVSRPTYVGGLGFGYKWDMGWMHDTLSYMSEDPIHRRYHQNELTFRMIYAFTENFCLPLSHDEVVHGKGSLLAKMPGDEWQKLANLRLLYGYMWAQPAKKLLFMGDELGQRKEWSHEASLDWHLLEQPSHAGLLQWVGDLNRAYRAEPALHELDCDAAGFEWVDASDHESSVLSFLRKGKAGGKNGDAVVLAVFNFTPVPRHDYRVGVPRGGRWQELLNSDAPEYGGSGVGNLGGVDAEAVEQHGRPWSVRLTLPPLGALLLRSVGGR